jgi:hypothetical protein
MSMIPPIQSTVPPAQDAVNRRIGARKRFPEPLNLHLAVNAKCNEVCRKAYFAAQHDQARSIRFWRAAVRLMVWLHDYEGADDIEDCVWSRATQ